MSKKVTFLIMSDRKGVTKRFVISSHLLKAMAIGGVAFFILFTSVFVDYFGLLFQDMEAKRLKVENRQLKQQFEVVESKLSLLESGLERIQTFTTKLRLITDTKAENRSLKLAMGPLAQTPTAIREEMDSSRNTASVVSGAHVLDEEHLNAKKGEMARRKTTDYLTLSIRIDRSLKEAKLRERNVLDLWETLSAQQALLRATPSIKPTRGWFTSGFGYRSAPHSGALSLHQGLDIAASTGTPVYAAADGIVSFAGYDGGYGKLVAIDHGYGVTTRYGHNSELFVVVGQKVKRGTVLSAVGNTGRSTASHLHYEVRVNGVPIDPKNYILE